jgi:proteasome assembly chaperone (PAC2) family protein
MTLCERHAHRPFDHPVLIVALDGWVDAGLGADGAISALLSAAPTELVATFDGETLIDQRARRPVVHIVDGVNRGLTWPVIQVRGGTDRDGHDTCFLVGPEPDFRWNAFVEAVVALARDLQVRMVVGLGAFPAPAPHTRPVRLAATAPVQSAELVERVGVVQGAIDVPSGVWGALELAFAEADISVVGLWARVPHYVSGMAFPAASAALVDVLAPVAGLRFESTALHTAADATFRQVDDLIARSDEHTAMVRKLESSVDEAEGNPLDVGHLPTADELGAELERYLQDDSGDSGTDAEG